MSEKFKYAPGKPGFGSKGDRGEDGKQGLSMYFTDYNPTTQRYIIESKIRDNQTLWSGSTEPLPDRRVYITGDLFFDSEGKAYEINAEDDTFQYKFASLNMGGFFLPLGISSSDGFQRYFNSNSSPKYIIDNVYTMSGAIDYTDVPETIYGIEPKDFTRIEFTNIKPNAGIYNPFTVYSSGVASGVLAEENAKALAIVYDEANKVFRIGNVDASGNLRNTNLIFDVSLLQHKKEFGKNTFNANTPLGAVLTNYEIAANSLFDPNFTRNPSSFYGVIDSTSCTVYWNLNDFVNDPDVYADLYFYEYIQSGYSGKTFNFTNDVSVRPLIFTNIVTDGSVKIIGTSSTSIYQYYIKFYKNGWPRNSEVQNLFLGVINVSPTSYTMSTSDGASNIGFDVDANFIWNVSIYQNPGGFMKLRDIDPCPSIGGLDGSIFFDIIPNASTKGRLGKTRVHLLPGSAIYKDISIYQPRGTIGPELFLYSPPPGSLTNFIDTTWPSYSVNASQNGTIKGSSNIHINVSTNRPWSLDTLPIGATLCPSSGPIGQTDVSLTCAENNSLVYRYGSFVFDCSGDLTTSLQVFQSPVDVWFEYSDDYLGNTRVNFPMFLTYDSETTTWTVNYSGTVSGTSKFFFSMHFSDDTPTIPWVWDDFGEAWLSFYGRTGSGSSSPGHSYITASGSGYANAHTDGSAGGVVNEYPLIIKVERKK